MKRIAIAGAILLFAASGRAQPERAPVTVRAVPTVGLCEASWMDAERVRALLAVEFGPDTAAVQIDVEACSDVAADVRVRFGGAESARTSHLDLSQTASGARSRLVALVVAELVRLGPPAVTAVTAVAAAVTAMEPAAGAEQEEFDVVVAEPANVVVAEPANVVVAEPANAEGAVELEPAANDDETEGGWNDGEDAVLTVAPPAAELPTTRCAGWSRFGRGPCSWALSLGYGVAFHQLGLLGESRDGPVFLHQLRLVGRWRYLFGGVRMYGVDMEGALTIGGVTLLAGVEWWVRRWSKNVLALRTGLEAGVHGTRGPRNVACPDCGRVGEPTVGAFTSVRYERAFGILRGAVELELGWSRGFRIDRSGLLAAGLGGPWLSINVDVSLGRAE